MAQISVKIGYDVKSSIEPEALCALAVEHGLTVEQVMPAIGVIFGSCDASDLGKLERLKGVLRVSHEDTFQLPPLSSDAPQ